MHYIKTMVHGVKQCGVLSPLLFSVYLDDLLCELRQANVGCHMNGYFVGAVIYADDITLLGPTRSSILSMLSVYMPEIWIFYLIRRKPIVYLSQHIPLHFQDFHYTL